MDYIKDVFLGQIHADNSDTLNEASLLLDSWKAVTDLEALRDHGAHRPLLQSAVLVRGAVDSLYRYMRDLPLYREHFLTMVCQSVMQYKVSMAQARFKRSLTHWVINAVSRRFAWQPTAGSCSRTARTRGSSRRSGPRRNSSEEC